MFCKAGRDFFWHSGEIWFEKWGDFFDHIREICFAKQGEICFGIAWEICFDKRQDLFGIAGRFGLQSGEISVPNLTFEREEEVKGIDFCGQTFARP